MYGNLEQHPCQINSPHIILMLSKCKAAFRFNTCLYKQWIMKVCLCTTRLSLYVSIGTKIIGLFSKKIPTIGYNNLL